jgi:predicted GNAT family acetyltransferase
MQVKHDIENQKFYLVVEGQESHLEYNKTGNVLNFYHTYVPDELRGRGIAAEIVKAGLSFAKKNDLKIVPTCSYVASYIQRHKEYNDLISE